VEMAATQSVHQHPSPGEQPTNKMEQVISTSHHQDQQQQQIQLGEVRTAKMDEDTVSELDLAPILPSERVLGGINLAF
jgi:hypothetical protein